MGDTQKKWILLYIMISAALGGNMEGPLDRGVKEVFLEEMASVLRNGRASGGGG